jgi:hypothetical protein
MTIDKATQGYLAWCPDDCDADEAREYVGITPGDAAEQHAEWMHRQGDPQEKYNIRVRKPKEGIVRECDVCECRNRDVIPCGTYFSCEGEERPPPMTRTSKYKPGDRVVALRWPLGGAGVLVKFAPVHSLVRWDGLKEAKRTSTADIRPETEEDVARRRHEQTMRAWQARQPKTSHISISSPALWGSTLSDGAQLYSILRTPETMRETAAELLQLADWFAERPVKL